MKEMVEKSLDPQLWQACAGGMVNIPPLNSKVFYFPQGHAEHAQSHVDFPAGIRIPASILCRVASLKFMADPDTDEVFAKIRLVPIATGDLEFDAESDGDSGGGGGETTEKPSSFAKTLTQSDANNGGGFSVPRYCAETIFPRLDYAADPPVQNVVARDVHGGVWKFRHIYRGTPRRHLLTTGWSNFVNQKKLVAGDSIVFLRAETGEICVGIRRAKRGGSEPHSGWNTGLSVAMMRDEEIKILGGGGSGRGSNVRGSGRVRPESVVEAAVRAANGQAFEVVYYPRLSTPEFCVKVSAVKAAMRVQWCSGMRFKMPFETEDSSRISWFMGTVGSVQVCDPIRWPQSPWRLLQVTWDEPDLLQNVKRVNPWLIESVSNMPVIHLSSFSPPRKKLRLPQQHPDFALDAHFHAALSSSASFLGNNSPLGLPSSNAPAGIQGARHALFGISLSDLHHHHQHQHTKLHHHHHHYQHPGPILHHPFNPIPRVPSAAVSSREALSCVLTMGNSSHVPEKSEAVKRHQFVLFGQPILTEQQISDGARASMATNGVRETEFGLDTTGHCKVFMESEDVGRTLDLTVLSSYEELYRRLANMFAVERSEMASHVLYHDATGVLKQTGDEPFSDFVKTAKRLTILTDSGNKKMGRTWITGIPNAENGLGATNKSGPLSIFA